MDYALSIDFQIASNDLLHISHSLALSHAPRIYEFAEITLIAELCNDVCIVDGGIDIQKLDHMLAAGHLDETFNL
jgi:hypothetical protein